MNLRSLALLLMLGLVAPALAAEAPASAGPEAAATPAAPAGLPRFHLVRPGVYRGGQPDAAGFAYLKSLGIKTIVKLDLPSEGSDAEAAKLGITVVDASGPPADVFSLLRAPSPQRIALAVQTLQDESKWPVYVHCHHGEDRTGLVVGLFRVLHDGYTKAAAYREMRANGFHRGLRGLHQLWEKFDGKTLPDAPTARSEGTRA